jgi:hypothetical protein
LNDPLYDFDGAKLGRKVYGECKEIVGGYNDFVKTLSRR